MMTAKAGELWIAEITFTDGSASKKRPILILWIDGDDVVVAAVTSSKPRTQTDVVLIDWEICGLRVDSTVRLSRLDCLERSLLIKKLGVLSASDAQALMEVWTQQSASQTKFLIKKHAQYTKSQKAISVLANWDAMVPKFVKVTPRDYKRVLQAIENALASGLSGDDALNAAFEENSRDVARIGGSYKSF